NGNAKAVMPVIEDPKALEQDHTAPGEAACIRRQTHKSESSKCADSKVRVHPTSAGMAAEKRIDFAAVRISGASACLIPVDDNERRGDTEQRIINRLRLLGTERRNGQQEW